MTTPSRTTVPAEHLARLDRHLDRLSLPPLGRHLVREAFGGDPVREPKGGPVNFRSRVALRKPGVTNDTESITLEFEYLYGLEADPDVLDYRTQAMSLTVRPLEPMADGSTSQRGWAIYPDVLVVRGAEVVAVDLMREEELERIAAERPWYIHRDGDGGTWRCPSAEAAAAAYGIRYEIRSSAQHSRLVARGLRYLYDYAIAELATDVASALVGRVSDEPGVTIGELVEDGHAIDDVLAAVAQHVVFLDLGRYPPDDHRHARLYADAAVAQAHEAAHPPSWALGSDRPPVPSVALGARYHLGDQVQEIRLCTGREVHLAFPDDPGHPIEIRSRADFDRLVADGVLVPACETLADRARTASAAIWASAPPAHRSVAYARFRAVEVFRANREAIKEGRALEPVPEVEGGIPSESSLERWHGASHRSERAVGDPLCGLLPKPRRGRPRNQLKPWVEKIIKTAIDGYYATGVGRGKEALVRMVRAQVAQLDPSAVPDRKPILERLRRRDPYLLTKAHSGSKVAYALKPYLPQDPDATPVRGLYPFQRVHYDTTLADISVLCEQTGRNLGRPTHGQLVDAYSDESLARGWTFGGPTGSDLLAVLVYCAERYGRLPEELILDGAASHLAEPVQVFCAIYGIHISYRPKEQSRFGGGGELQFGRITEGLLHQLPGNTKAAKDVRKLTKATNPREHAVLSLAAVAHLVDLWHELVDDARIVTERGLSPHEALERGMVEHGSRASRAVVVDELFRIQALIPAGERTAQGVKGIQYANLTYQHDCLRHHGVRNHKLDIAADERDVSRLSVFVPAHYHGPARVEATWVEARCRLLAPLRFVSVTELRLATKTVRQRRRDDNRKRIDVERAIVAVLLEAEYDSDQGLERRRSLAAAKARGEALDAPPRPAVTATTATADETDPDPLSDPLTAAARSIRDAYYASDDAA